MPGDAFKTEHAEVVGLLRKEIRQRHYSLRTEQAYESWILRFLVFSQGKPLDSGGAEEVRNYLDYLVQERQVAASTQSQALNALVFFFNHALRKRNRSAAPHLHAIRPAHIEQL